jgi:hypothetical protein
MYWGLPLIWSHLCFLSLESRQRTPCELCTRLTFCYWWADFRRFVEKRGVGSMELVASELKGRGAYIARTLSYEHAQFETVQVPMTESAKATWDAASAFWIDLLDGLHQALDLTGESPKHFLGAYWSAHLQFFRELCTSCKLDSLVQMAEEAIKDGKCVVIGMQATGEANLKQWISAHPEREEWAELPCTLSGIIDQFITNNFPSQRIRKASRKKIVLPQNDRDQDEEQGEDCDDPDLQQILSQEHGGGSDHAIAAANSPITDPDTVEAKLSTITNTLRRKHALLDLPPCPLDALTHKLGGFDKVILPPYAASDALYIPSIVISQTAVLPGRRALW